MNTFLVELVGWVAAGLTLVTYSCRTMLPLRISAVVANACFLAYGALAGIYPSMVLHMLLLPLNAYRLVQIVGLTRKAKAAMHADDAFAWIAHLQKPSAFAAGTQLFAAGDEADSLYYLVSGSVRLAEIGKSLAPGTLFGEIAFFADPRRRTATAVCESDCEIVVLDETRFMLAFHQDPSFALALMRLVARRLIENADRRGAPPDLDAVPRGAAAPLRR